MGKFRLNLKKFMIFPIQVYQYLISPLFPAKCRFSPTCSQYALESIEIHGVIKGLWMIFYRIFRCHPFSVGGYDPVPEKKREF